MTFRASALAATACWISVGGAAIATSPIGADEETGVASLVAEWFAWLESQPSEGWVIDTFMAESPLAFLLTEAGDPGPDDFAGWLFALRSQHPEVEYRLDEVHLDSLGENLVRVRFEFDRHAVDAAGLPHVARREQTWLVRNLPGEAPVVLRIEEQRLLAFPGTGPQVVCY